MANKPNEEIVLQKDRHVLIPDATDENGNWLVLDKLDNSLFYITPDVNAINFFTKIPIAAPVTNTTTTNSIMDEPITDNKEDDSNEQLSIEINKTSEPEVGKWNRRSILLLINNYKINYKRMCGTSIKNALVWNDITADINKEGFNYTKKQVENKFKYLKSKYTKKKDNMGDKATGASPISFDYFDEFDEIFGEKPSIKPTNIASTSSGKRSLDEVEEIKTENSSKKIKKAGATKNDFSGWINNFQERDKKKEENRDRRHQERQEMLNKSIQTFDQLMNKLIDKM